MARVEVGTVLSAELRPQDQAFAEEFRQIGQARGFEVQFGFVEPSAVYQDDGYAYALVMPQADYDRAVKESNQRRQAKWDVINQGPFYVDYYLGWEEMIDQPTYATGTTYKEALLASLGKNAKPSQ